MSDSYSLFEEDELAVVDEVSAEDAEPLFDEQQIIEAAFSYFRSIGFPYRKLALHTCMQQLNKLASLPLKSLLHTGLGYHVADTYHPHRFHAAAVGMRSPYDTFADDKLFRVALQKLIRYEREIPETYFTLLSLVNGAQGCSNFRPGFACYLYRKYCKTGDTVLDCSTGYGGRLVGYIASKINGRYIGIDPNTLTHQGNLKLSQDLYDSSKVELYNLPVEDVDPALLANRCDFAFTSPPYFCKEVYSSEDTQSCNRYLTIDEWVEGFLVPFFKLQYIALKPGTTALVNIADVNIRGKSYPLASMAVEAGKSVGFTYITTERFDLPVSMGQPRTGTLKYEPLLVFEKKEG